MNTEGTDRPDPESHKETQREKYRRSQRGRCEAQAIQIE